MYGAVSIIVEGLFSYQKCQASGLLIGVVFYIHRIRPKVCAHWEEEGRMHRIEVDAPYFIYYTNTTLY